MKTISRYIMTLALLLTAASGAWATEPELLVTINSNENTSFTSGSKTFDDKVTVTFSNGVYNYGDNDGWFSTETASLLTVTGINGYTITSCKFYTANGIASTGYTIEGESPSVYLYFFGVYPDASKSVKIGSYGITKIEVYGTAPAPDPNAVEVTTNAASEGATFTEATFAMPAFDATADYELVRDMGYKVAFSGVPTRARLAKDGDGKFHFADGLTFQLLDNIDAANPKDITSVEGITFMVGKMVEMEGFEGYRQFDEATAVSLADFLANPQPGTYKMKATATADGPYDGTIYSAEFTTVEKYDLAIQPADEYSKGKIESVIVGTESVTIDANTGEATKTGIAPGAEVKLKAKRGYVIEKVEAKKIVPAEGHDLTASAVGDIVGSDGKTYAAADKDNLPKNVTAVAMVAYKNGTGGLAIALSDEGSMNFSTAKSTCESKTAISGATWQLPSKNQWEQIFSANGGNNNSCTGLNTAIDNAGGTALVAGNVYWTTSSAIVSGSYYCLIINTGGSITSQIGSSGNNKMTRAILIF